MLRRARLLSMAVLAASLSLGGCVSGGAPATGPGAGGADEARVRVTNHNWADMTVYVIRSGIRQRLGTVTTMASQLFRIPSNLVGSSGEIQLVADPIGSAEVHLTQPVQVWPGQTLDFRIENHLAISSVVVRE